MVEPDLLAREFEEHRTRLRAVAYRMLGSLSESDDVAIDVLVDPERLPRLELAVLDG